MIDDLLSLLRWVARLIRSLGPATVTICKKCGGIIGIRG